MTQIIILDNDVEVTTVLRVTLAKKYGWDVIVKESSSETISLLQILSGIELIICRDAIGKDAAGAKLCDYLLSNAADFEKEIPVLILGKKNSAYNSASEIDPILGPSHIVARAGKLLGLAVEEPPAAKIVQAPLKEEVVKPAVVIEVKVKVDPEAYSGLNTKYFLNLAGDQVPFNSYTRAKKKDGGFEYALKIPTATVIERTDIERIVTRGVSELFIAKNELSGAMAFVNARLIARVKDVSITGLDRVQLSSDVFDITLDLIKQLAINEFTIELISENIKALKHLVLTENVFALFNNSLKIKKISYGFSHCFLTSIIMNKLHSKFEWASDDMKNKVPFVAYFHDLTLQNDKLIKMHHHYFQEAKNFSSDEAAIVLPHAMAAAAIVEKIKNIPPDIVTMIKEHHGIKAGKGYSETLSIIASPFAMSFLTVEEFVTRYLDFPIEEIAADQVKAIFLEMDAKFNKQGYGETLKALKELYK